MSQFLRITYLYHTILTCQTEPVNNRKYLSLRVVSLMRLSCGMHLLSGAQGPGPPIKSIKQICNWLFLHKTCPIFHIDRHAVTVTRPWGIIKICNAMQLQSKPHDPHTALPRLGLRLRVRQRLWPPWQLWSWSGLGVEPRRCSFGLYACAAWAPSINRNCLHCQKANNCTRWAEQINRAARWPRSGSELWNYVSNNES